MSHSGMKRLFNTTTAGMMSLLSPAKRIPINLRLPAPSRI